MRGLLMVTMLLLASLALASDLRPAYVVEAEEERKAGIDRPGRILVSTIDSGGEFVVVDSVSSRTYKTPLHTHVDHHEALLIQTGKIKATVEEQTHVLGPGDFVFLPKGKPHRLEVLEPGRAILVGSAGLDESSARLFKAFANGDGKSAAEIYEELPDVDYVAD